MSAVGWIVVINPMSAILFITPYRDAILRGLRIFKPVIEAESIPRNSNPSPTNAI